MSKTANLDLFHAGMAAREEPADGGMLGVLALIFLGVFSVVVSLNGNPVSQDGSLESQASMTAFLG
jgi:hypothetical protein